MQTSHSTTVWEKLLVSGLLTGEQPTNEMSSPWYIKLLLAVSGWFGALFLVIFIGGSFGIIFGWNMEEYAILPAIFGVLFIYIAYRIFQEKQSDFFEHFLLALSIVGQVMVIFSLLLLFHFKEDIGIALFITLFQAFLIWVIPHYMHRMLSSFFMALSFSYFFYALHAPFIANSILTFMVSWMWMHEFQWRQHSRTEAIAYGQTAALVWLNYIFLALPYATLDLSSRKLPSLDGWMAVLFLVLSLVYVVWMLLKENQKLMDKKVLILSLFALFLIGAFSIKVSGLIVGIILMLIGFAHAHRLLVGLGIFSTLVFLSHYYYFTGETLMEKSGMLVLLGILLLLSRFVMKIVLGKVLKDA